MIPADDLTEMGLTAGRTCLWRISPMMVSQTDTTSSQFHRYLFLNWIPPQQIAIPQQLLEQAGIDSNAEVQIACMDGAIIITGDTPLTENEFSEVVDRLRAVNDLTKHFPSELDTEEGGTGYSIIPYT